MSPVFGKAHFGVPAVGLDVLTQGGDFEGAAAFRRNRHNRPVRDTDGNGFPARPGQAPSHGVGVEWGGDIDIALTKLTQHQIPHTATDKARVPAQQVDQLRRCPAVRCQQQRRIDGRDRVVTLRENRRLRGGGVCKGWVVFGVCGCHGF